MELSFTNVAFRHHPLSPTHHSRFRSRSVTFHKTTSFSFSSSSSKPIKSSFPNSNNYQNPNPSSNYCHITKTLKTTVITGVTVASVFFSRFTFKPSIAAAVLSPPPVATVESITDSKSEYIKALKNRLDQIKTEDVNEIIEILNELIYFEPKNSEWKMVKSHLHWYCGDNETAKLGFEEVLTNDPLIPQAYLGLARVIRSESVAELKNLDKRIMEKMNLCKKEKKKDVIREFKILLAKMSEIDGKFNDALKIYEELCKEKPGDFRQYYFQGVLYEVLGMNDDADKSFGKFWKLVPKEDPHATLFDNNIYNYKIIAQKLEDERAYLKSRVS